MKNTGSDKLEVVKDRGAARALATFNGSQQQQAVFEAGLLIGGAVAIETLASKLTQQLGRDLPGIGTVR